MKQVVLFFLSTFFCVTAIAQPILPADSVIESMHEVTIKGQKVPYKAICGTQPVWNDKGEAEAALFYTYYERTDVKDRDSRPLVISFNGGPGSASVWMHLAYTGPKILKITDEGYPVQPYGVRDNPYSILDVADIVFVNPVNTGYSRLLKEDADRKNYFGVNADIAYLAEWINTFVTRKNRWASPKYLIGESYGTTRVSGLALQLQNSNWMYLNGVILVSPTGLGIDRDGPVAAANRLPYFAAAAWYHEQLAPELQAKDLEEELLPEVEVFTINELLPAMAKGGFLDPATREEMAEKMAYYSGLSAKTYLQHNLDVDYAYFWKDLLREEGYTVGRLDSRYKGMDRMDGGTRPDFNSELTSWLHSFTPAINYYFKNVLGYHTDVKYNMFGPVRPWDRSGDNTGENLRQAMAQNPYLKVMVQSGYYDGATTYFNAKYTMWHMDPSGRLKDRLRFEGYRSGHMMYLRRDDLQEANEHIREFIESTIPGEGVPAKY
jgi:carboxypeptidase C (cathepsin A)